jgi:hypothetical protein
MANGTEQERRDLERESISEKSFVRLPARSTGERSRA